MAVMDFFSSQFSSSIFDIRLIMSARVTSSTFEPVDTCTRLMPAGSVAEEDEGGREEEEEDERGGRLDADDD